MQQSFFILFLGSEANNSKLLPALTEKSKIIFSKKGLFFKMREKSNILLPVPHYDFTSMLPSRSLSTPETIFSTLRRNIWSVSPRCGQRYNPSDPGIAKERQLKLYALVLSSNPNYPALGWYLTRLLGPISSFLDESNNVNLTGWSWEDYLRWDLALQHMVGRVIVMEEVQKLWKVASSSTCLCPHWPKSSKESTPRLPGDCSTL